MGDGLRGDIILYTGESWRDRYVCAYSGGPYCHCEIDLGEGASIGVHSEDGLAYRWSHLLERRVIFPLHLFTDDEHIEAGIAWVLKQIGEPFSWASVADLALPSSVSTLLFGRRSRYSCANLVALYLDITGGLPLPHGKRPPMILSPNDIARAAGLLPPDPAASRGGTLRLFTALASILASSDRVVARQSQTPSK